MKKLLLSLIITLVVSQIIFAQSQVRYDGSIFDIHEVNEIDKIPRLVKDKSNLIPESFINFDDIIVSGNNTLQISPNRYSGVSFYPPYSNAGTRLTYASSYSNPNSLIVGICCGSNNGIISIDSMIIDFAENSKDVSFWWGTNGDYNIGIIDVYEGANYQLVSSNTVNLYYYWNQFNISVSQKIRRVILRRPNGTYQAGDGHIRLDNFQFFPGLPPTYSPTGYLDSVQTSDPVGAVGWSVDPDNTSASNTVHCYVNGPAGSGSRFLGAVTANLPSPGVPYPGNHRFLMPIPADLRNNLTHQMYCYGIDITGGDSPTLLTGSPKPFRFITETIGWIDSVSSLTEGNNAVAISEGEVVGWSLDTDLPGNSNTVHFYIDGPAGSGTYIDQTLANIPRPDVNTITGYPGNHGFSYFIPDQYRDGLTHTIYAYGIDLTGGPPKLLQGSPKTFRLNLPQSDVSSVGFDGDFQILIFAQYDGNNAPPIQDPTWTKGSSSNPDNIVAYTKGTEATKMKLSASFNVTPSTAQNLNAKVRVKYNNNVIATTSNSILVTDGVFSIQNLGLDANAKLEPIPQVKKGTYTFSWEVSYNNGQNWNSAGSTEHIIYWTYADPINPEQCRGDGIFGNCIFVNNGVSTDTENYEFEGLFDFALKSAINPLDSETQSKSAITKELANQIDIRLKYNPVGSLSGLGHPLFYLYYPNTLGVVCSGNSSLLQGLLRSIGIDSRQVFVWGGVPTNLEVGGKIHFYNYRHIVFNNMINAYQLVEEQETLRAKRPIKNSGGENVEQNPHFVYHALVELEGKYYDPSYGSDLFLQSDYPFSAVKLQEVINFQNPTSPKFKIYPDTIPITVKALHLPRFCTTNNCNPNTRVTDRFCGHSLDLPTQPIKGDFDNDDKTDISVFRPSNGSWYIKKSSDQSMITFQFGTSGDKVVPGDYDGDSKTDIAVFRPSNGTWYVTRSSDNAVISTQFGVSTDKPISGDYDGDGKSDIAIFRPSSGEWYRLNSSNGAVNTVPFGATGDVPVNGNYDGDNKTDIAVFRPSTGAWYRLNSSNGGVSTSQFGLSEDIPIPADFDNDNKTDIAVFRPSSNTWYIQGSTDGFYAFSLGEINAVPSVGNFDDDGIPDPVVWSPNTGHWKVLQSETNTIVEDYFGTVGDIPIGSAYNR